MKTNLKILGAEQKTASNERSYYSFKTSDGVMSCFDEKVVKEIVQHAGNEILEVEVKASNGFKNITKFYGISAQKELTEIPEDDVIAEAKAKKAVLAHVGEDKFSEARTAKDVSIYTSYCKDIFITLLEQQKKLNVTSDAGYPQISDLMDMAIGAVKQARDGFK